MMLGEGWYAHSYAQLGKKRDDTVSYGMAITVEEI
jgi:hypothetical protein